MTKRPTDLFDGAEFETKSGKLIVTGYSNAKSVNVRFIKTGFETTAQAVDVRRGSVKDPFAPLIFGVGFFGVGNYKARENGKLTVRYNTWADMIQRCYDPKWHKKKPTYRDCSVCEEWYNYQVFSEWFEKNYIEGFHLDKDIKVNGNRVYSPETCLFVSPKDNAEKAFAKTQRFINPQGEIVEIYNIREYCKDKDLHPSGLCNVNRGKYKSYKGWTKAN